MQTSREDLAKAFGELDDAALLRRLREHALTDEGHVAAIAELRARGLDLARLGVDADVSADLDGDADECEPDEPASDSLTAVAQFSFPIDAQLLQARLEADGIPAWVTNANTVQAFGYLRNAVGGVRVMVPTRLVDAAKAVMAALAAGEYALDENESGVDGDAA